MNTRIEALPLVDAEATIKRLDAIAQTVQACRWVASGDHNIEGEPAILDKHSYRCLRPG